MSKDVKTSENDYAYSHAEALKHWRSWGSWYSWGSPVGLVLFFIGLSLCVYILSLAGII